MASDFEPILPRPTGFSKPVAPAGRVAGLRAGGDCHGEHWSTGSERRNASSSTAENFCALANLIPFAIWHLCYLDSSVWALFPLMGAFQSFDIAPKMPPALLDDRRGGGYKALAAGIEEALSLAGAALNGLSFSGSGEGACSAG